MSADIHLPAKAARKRERKRASKPQRPKFSDQSGQTTSAGENTPQPVCYTREDGTEMRFPTVSGFLAFWIVEERHKMQEAAA